MDNLTKAQRKKNMQNIRSNNTAPERLIMQELRRRRIYFAHHVKSLTGKPDIVFRRKKIVVFIDSDFWHGHPARYIKPKSNRKYWLAKIRRNKERDAEVNTILKKSGWKVIRIWEADIKRSIERCVKKVLRQI